MLLLSGLSVNETCSELNPFRLKYPHVLHRSGRPSLRPRARAGPGRRTRLAPPQVRSGPHARPRRSPRRPPKHLPLHPHRRNQRQGQHRLHPRQHPDHRRLPHRPLHLAAPLPRQRAHPDRRPPDPRRRLRPPLLPGRQHRPRLIAEGALPHHPSFFEVLTALAFLYFAEQRTST